MGDTELGAFLRSRRSRVLPEQVGLPPSVGVRRTAGLRREEVAILAGVSVDYYRRLEQGKQRRPSASVLAAIAGVLRLTDDEHRHLVGLAQHAARHSRSARAGRAVRAEVRRMLEIVLPYPACVLGLSGDVLAANAPGQRLFPGIDEWPEHRRNTCRHTFLHPAARRLYDDWQDVAQGVVAHLRAADTTHPGAPELRELVTELTAESPDFAALWHRHDVRTRTHGRKTYRHPDVGPMTLSYEAFPIPRSDGQRLVVYQAPPDTPDHDALLRLT